MHCQPRLTISILVQFAPQAANRLRIDFPELSTAISHHGEHASVPKISIWRVQLCSLQIVCIAAYSVQLVVTSILSNTAVDLNSTWSSARTSAPYQLTATSSLSTFALMQAMPFRTSSDTELAIVGVPPTRCEHYLLHPCSIDDPSSCVCFLYTSSLSHFHLEHTLDWFEPDSSLQLLTIVPLGPSFVSTCH